LSALIPVEAEVKAHQLPAAESLAEYRAQLSGIQSGAADDCVRILAGEGASLKASQERLRQVREAVDEAGLAAIRQARAAAGQMWPPLAARVQNGDLASSAATLQALLASETFYLSMAEIKARSKAIAAAYRETYTGLHDQRAAAFGVAIEAVKGHPDWTDVPAEMQGPILGPLVARACRIADLPAGAVVCRACSAGLSQMESDIVALNGLKAQAAARIVEITAPITPGVKTERVYLADFFPDDLDSREAIDEAVERLREHLVKLLDEGVKIILE